MRKPWKVMGWAAVSEVSPSRNCKVKQQTSLAGVGLTPLLKAAIFTALIPVLAHATLVSSSSASLFNTVTNQTTNASQQCISVTGASACAAYGPDSTVSANGDFTVLAASATAYYGFEILGPVNPNVPLLIQGATSVSAYGGAAIGGAMELWVTNSSNTILSLFSYSTAGGAPGGFVKTVDWGSDVVSQLIISVGCTPGLGGQCSSEIDPTIEIDPSFLASNPGYSLIEDGSEFPPSTAPEPGTLQLLAIGAAALCLVLRLRFARRGSQFRDLEDLGGR